MPKWHVVTLVESPLQNWTDEELMKEQSSDNNCNEIIKCLETNTPIPGY